MILIFFLFFFFLFNYFIFSAKLFTFGFYDKIIVIVFNKFIVFYFLELHFFYLYFEVLKNKIKMKKYFKKGFEKIFEYIKKQEKLVKEKIGYFEPPKIDD